MSDLNSHTAIAEERIVLGELQAEAQGPEDVAYLQAAGAELDAAKAKLLDPRQAGRLVLTAEGTIEPEDKMQAMIRDGSYVPSPPSSGGGRV